MTSLFQRQMQLERKALVEGTLVCIAGWLRLLHYVGNLPGDCCQHPVAALQRQRFGRRQDAGQSKEGNLPTEILLEDTDGLHRPP